MKEKIKKKIVKNIKNKETLHEALYNKAVGYSTQEITEEFSRIEDELVLIKRKLSTKKYPPDLSALQLLLENIGENYDEYENLSLEDLKIERDKLLEKLKTIEIEKIEE